MANLPDHPDIVAIQETGYPAGAELENKSTPEWVRKFAEDYCKEFIDFAMDGDPDILDNFAEHYSWLYNGWLN